MRLVGCEANTPNPRMTRLVQILMEHLTYAEENPQDIALHAKRLGCTRIVALAATIANHIGEELFSGDSDS